MATSTMHAAMMVAVVVTTAIRTSRRIAIASGPVRRAADRVGGCGGHIAISSSLGLCPAAHYCAFSRKSLTADLARNALGSRFMTTED